MRRACTAAATLAALTLVVAGAVSRGAARADTPAVDRLARYRYNAAAALNAAARPIKGEAPNLSRLRTRYRVTYTSANRERVPAILSVPRKGKAPYPAVLLLAGSGGHKDTDYVRIAADMLATLGMAALSIDAQYHGDRARPGRSGDIHLVNDPVMCAAWVQTVVDLRRGLDYLRSRRDIDARRIGFLGFSQGAMIGSTLLGVEPRLRCAVLAVGGGGLAAWATEAGLGGPSEMEAVQRGADTVDPVHFVGRFAPRPLLLLNARRDELIPVSAAEALHKAAGPGKEVVWFDTGHILSPSALLVNVRGFFKKHLGR